MKYARMPNSFHAHGKEATRKCLSNHACCRDTSKGNVRVLKSLKSLVKQ